MVLCLVRHGDAVSATDNPDRPLSPGGRAGVERLGQLGRERGVKVSAIYHSGILRAQQTAAILAEHLAPRRGIEQRAGLLPDDDPAVMKAELEEARESVLLVGHLPYLSRLAGLLITGDPDRTVVEFSPATMVCFVNEHSQWNIAWKLNPEFL
jgi:phosphohistidine phosphatase